MAEICGFVLPAHYGDVVAEHTTATEGVGVIDRSLVGKVTVTGRDRQAFLQGMLSRTRSRASSPGQGTAAAFLDAHGKVMALLHVYVLEDRLLLELPPGLTRRTLELLDKFLISEKAYFEAPTRASSVLAVEGPGAPTLLSRRSRGRSLDLAPYQSRGSRHRGGAGARDRAGARRAGPGFQCWTMPFHGAALWRALVDGRARPVGAEALEHPAGRGGHSVVRAGRRRDRDPARDAARAPRELQQGVLYRPGGRGPRQVPRAREPRADRARARGGSRAGIRRAACVGDGQGDRADHLRGAVRRPRPSPSRSATSAASTSPRDRPSPSWTATRSMPGRVAELPFVSPMR